MTIEIREAASDDVPAMVPLLGQLGHPADASEIRRRFDRLAGDGPGDLVLVARSADRVVGLAVLHMTPMLHRPTDVGRVTALVVDSEFRGQGIGAALVERAERTLQARGCARIEITSAHAAAHGFYRRSGYADEGIRFARKLPAGQHRPRRGEEKPHS